MKQLPQRPALFTEALDKFPDDSLRKHCHTLCHAIKQKAYYEYSEEYIFPVGHLFGADLMAWGSITYRQKGERESVIAVFNIVRKHDWQAVRILGEYEALCGEYDANTQTWILTIDRIF